MRIRKSTDLEKLFGQIEETEGEVFFQSDDGSILNLKSALSQFLFISVVKSDDIEVSGDFVCDEPDRQRIISALGA